MDGERKSCTERILSAIEYGKLPNDETERRLCELVEAEVNKTDSEADMELIKACQSLMWQLHTHGERPYDSHFSENKAMIGKRLRRKSVVTNAIKSVGKTLAAAAAIVLVVLGLRGDFQWNWLEHDDTEDQQQHIITGAEIGVEMIQKAIAENLDIGQIRVTSPHDIPQYFDFVPVPQTINEMWLFQLADVTVTPGFACIDVLYENAKTQSNALYSAFLFLNPEEAYFTFEQSAEGYSVMVDGHQVYITKNIDKWVVCWTDGLVFVRITGEFQEQEVLLITQCFLKEWYR